MDAKIERVQSAGCMSRFACRFACLVGGLVAWLGIVAGCQRSAEPAPPPVSDYRADIENLCDVIVRSGADRMDPSERALVIANWLAARLKTPEAHDYLIKIQPLSGEDKATALEAEAKRVGLTRCALAAEWRTPATPATPATR